MDDIWHVSLAVRVKNTQSEQAGSTAAAVTSLLVKIVTDIRRLRELRWGKDEQGRAGFFWPVYVTESESSSHQPIFCPSTSPG